MKISYGLATVALAVASLGTSAQTVTSLDFTAGPLAGTTIAGNSLRIQGYQFTGSDVPVLVSRIGFWRGVDWGWGMVAPLQTTPLAQASITVSRTDGQVFSLLGINPFVGGILVGGMADFEVTPFDAAGNELDPVTLPAGQFYTSFAVPAVYTMLSDMSAFRLSPSLVDHYTGFQFSATTAPVPEPTNWALLMAGLVVLVTRRGLCTALGRRA